MKIPTTGSVQRLIVCSMLLLLSMNAPAWDPDAKALDAAINAGDFTGYFANLSAWLDQKTPADPGHISLATMTTLIEDPAFRNALDQRQFIARHGVTNMSAFAGVEGNRTFLAWVLTDTRLMDLYLEGATPSRDSLRELNAYAINITSLDRWKALYTEDPDSREGVYLKLAMACALAPPGGRCAYRESEIKDWRSRYEHYKTAHQKQELVPSFEHLTVSDYARVINSRASNIDLAWGRQMVNTWRPDLLENEQIPRIVSEVWRRFSPIPFTNGFITVMEGGGKCGPRGAFGAFICNAFGIPSMGVGQPAHYCFAAKTAYPELEPQPGSAWKVFQGRGWQVSDCGDAMWGPEFLSEMDKRLNVAGFSLVEHVRWLASTLTSKERAEAAREVARNIWRAMPVVDQEALAVEITLRVVPFDSEPHETAALDAFMAPSDAGENYGARVRGFVYPPQTGEYEFYIASDDDSMLFLSTDAAPGHKMRVASLRGWSGLADFEGGKPSQKSTPVLLEGGKRYYIEAQHRELDGGDHLAVGWSGPGVTKGVILGKYLSPYPQGKRGKIMREVWPIGGTAVAAEPEAKPEPPFQLAPGVIHVEAETFTDKSPEAHVYNCYTGGKQVNFHKSIPLSWLDYAIDVPETGTYAMQIMVAAANRDQVLNVRCGEQALGTISIPGTTGLWKKMAPVEIELKKGIQTLKISAPSQRGVAIRWFELKQGSIGAK